MRVFILIVFFVLALLWYFVGASLFYPLLVDTDWEWAGWLFLGATYALQIWRWTAFDRSDERPLLLLATYFALGLMCHLMLAAIIADVAQIFIEVPHPVMWALILLALVINAWSLNIGMQGPLVREIEIKSGLPGKPLHIVQISDLHVGPIIQKKYVQKVVDRILPLKPDLIVATGDIGDGKAHLLDEALQVLKKMTQGCPAYYVSGNHEYYWGIESWITEMEKLGFQHLQNRGLTIDLPGKIPLWLGGVPDLAPEPEKAISQDLARHHYKLLLAHQPKVCFAAEKAGFDLMMCGHTHGGQFFPFTMLVGLFNPYTRGLNLHHKMKVYVNVGTGFWGPPLRFGARAEITSLRIT